MYGNYERHITRAAHIERVQNRVSECERERERRGFSRNENFYVSSS